MINKFILPLLAVLLLGSCANKFSLVKRKYNKGYYLDLSRNNPQKKHENEKALALKTKNVNAVSPANAAETPEIKVSEIQMPVEQQNPVVSSTLTKKNNVESAAKPVTASADKKITHSAPAFKPLTSAVLNMKSGKAAADTNLIVLVILCFLWWLNLIAVYIHDGKKITLNFWITLLLDFTFIGGVIFSLLVVLDVINLA